LVSSSLVAVRAKHTTELAQRDAVQEVAQLLAAVRGDAGQLE
jgi:hypothetical protein